MPKNDIGGFFVSLGLNPDKNSFETGSKLIDSVSTSLNKLIGTARNAAVALTGTAVVTGAVEQSNLKLSDAMGTSIDNLNVWTAAAKIAGVNASGLIGSMSQLADVLNHQTIDGSGIDKYADQLWKLGLNWQDIEKMDPAKAYEKIIATAQTKAAEAQKKIAEAQKALELNPNDTEAQKNLEEAKTEKQNATVAVKDILGTEAQGLYTELQRQGITIAELLNRADRTVLTTAEDANKSADFAVQVNTLKTEVESIGKLIGAEAAEILKPYVEDINDWIQNNGDTIRDKIKDIFQTTEKIIGKGIDSISKWWDKHGDNLAGNIKNLYETTTKVIGDGVKKLSDWWDQNGDQVLAAIQVIGQEVAMIIGWLTSEKAKEKAKGIKEILGSAWETSKGIFSSAWSGNFGAIPTIYLNGLDDMWEGIKDTVGIKDGIIRPDGTVTQVAPDDWVFAARNVGDMARAFVPQAQMLPTATNQEYTINQTFNIQGGANDIPAVIKQQAYKGTQDALLLAMQQSSNRLQQMSGTR